MKVSNGEFENNLSLVNMDKLSVDIDAEAFYKFNWRLYLDDEFRINFYENPQKVLVETGINNINLSNTDIKKVDPFNREEREIINILNSPGYTPLRAEEEGVLVYGDYLVAHMVAIATEVAGAAQAVVAVLLLGAPVDGADLVPEILRKKAD
ncbi:MAG: hypothetical protein LBE70_05155 [Nitrososphaerota archaeon]|jgi:hypothetical protein|nr:hypothetical protein [Nitrososphaerota archaeon]